MSKTVLITGCSSGFGKLTAKKFQQEGWNVIATMRSPEKEQELTQIDNIWVTRLDVTDRESIDTAVREGMTKFGNIEVLVNNAGYGGHAALEQFTEAQFKAMFDTNVFGVIRTSQALLPHMRKQQKGVIINVTSMAGLVGLPLTSTYSASKFAVEGLTQSLAHEYKPFGIGVKSVAPGAFTTKFTENTRNNYEAGDSEITAFAQKGLAHFYGLAQQMRQQGGKEADPQDVADIIYRCATEETPVHNVVGSDAEMINEMKNSLPQQEFIEQMGQMLMPQ
ncbi:MAG: SDR family oxidoreductase [Bacteroidota bacterium]